MSSSNQDAKHPANASANDIAWLSDTLFATSETVVSAPSIRSVASRRSSKGTITWTELPRRGTTRRLVPTRGRDAAEAFTNVHDAMSTKRRAVGRVTQIAARTGVLGLLSDREADVEMLFGDPAVSVIAAAADGLGQTICSCAITLGPQRYNRKPVVQLMNARAETVGYLKVGADPATSSMVATEAAIVHQLVRPAMTPLQLPELLWQADWHGRTAACFSSVAVDAGALVPADPQRLTQTAHAVIAAGGGSAEVPFRDAAIFEQLNRFDACSLGIGSLADRARTTVGSSPVATGLWHGDFSPWNMISTASTTALLDWEFAGHGMPVGSDLLHHRVMVATHLDNEPVSHPLQQLVDRADDVHELWAMNIPVEQHRPSVLLYLFELVRRDLELRRANRPDTGFGDAAAAAIDAILTKPQL